MLRSGRPALLIITGALMLGAVALHAVQAAGLPRAQVDQEIIDLGQAIRGERREAEFVVRNTGNADLRILDVKPG